MRGTILKPNSEKTFEILCSLLGRALCGGEGRLGEQCAGGVFVMKEWVMWWDLAGRKGECNCSVAGGDGGCDSEDGEVAAM